MIYNKKAKFTDLKVNAVKKRFYGKLSYAKNVKN